MGLLTLVTDDERFLVLWCDVDSDDQPFDLLGIFLVLMEGIYEL